MDVVLLYFDDCPNWRVTAEHLDIVASELDDVTVSGRRIETAEEAKRVGFHGSPSILVDGVDPFAGPRDGIGLSCRRYTNEHGPAGSPTLAQIRQAVDGHG